MMNIPTTLTLILSGLRAAVGAYLARRDRAASVVWLGTQVFVSVSAPLTRAEQTIAAIRPETWTLLWTRLGRLAARFQNLFEAWRAGTLRPPAPPRPGRPTRPSGPRLPTSRAWVIAAAGHQAAGHASQLNTLMAEPDCAAFLTAVPRAARLLRPLCRILGIDPLPPPLIPAPRRAAQHPRHAPALHPSPLNVTPIPESQKRAI